MKSMLEKFAVALSTYDQEEKRKNGAQLSNRLSRKEVLYQLHSTRVKLLFLHTAEKRCVLPPDQVLRIIEAFPFQDTREPQGITEAQKLVGTARVSNIISDCIKAFQSIESWNYKAAYRHAWTGEFRHVESSMNVDTQAILSLYA